jgi:hypothetical protein
MLCLWQILPAQCPCLHNFNLFPFCCPWYTPVLILRWKACGIVFIDTSGSSSGIWSVPPKQRSYTDWLVHVPPRICLVIWMKFILNYIIVGIVMGSWLAVAGLLGPCCNWSIATGYASAPEFSLVPMPTTISAQRKGAAMVYSWAGWRTPLVQISIKTVNVFPIRPWPGLQSASRLRCFDQWSIIQK